MSENQLSVCVCQFNVRPGHPDLNVLKILQEIRDARNAGDDLIVFSEMAVPGYLLGDEWENSAYIKDCFAYNEEIMNATEGITAIWGNVDIDVNKRGEDGRIRKYNAAFIAQNKHYIDRGCVHKMLMPKYREFDDERHFYSLRKEAQDNLLTPEEVLSPFKINFKGIERKVGIILCEDMWSDDYTIDPVQVLLKKNAELIINISCSPWTWRKNNKRHAVVRERIKHHPVHFVYANNTGIQNNGKNIFLFDGNSTIYHPDGSLLKVARNYEEETIRASLFGTEVLPGQQFQPDLHKDDEELYTGILYGIKKFFENFPTRNVVLGLSGGIDSALSAVLLSEALGAAHVYAVNMPSRYNSETTRNAAHALASSLGIHYTSIPIQQSFEHTISQIETTVFCKMDPSKHATTLKLSGLNRENIQARDRGARILAGVASALNAVFINNGNKTETGFGYATLYGDVNGALAPLGDLYKMEVYRLAAFVNSKRKVIPETIFHIPASAELSEDQNVDEGKGDPLFYPYHDQLLKAFVEFRMDPEDILKLYAEGKLGDTIHFNQQSIVEYFKDHTSFIMDLEHKWKLFKLSIFKRIQAPPIIAVSKRAFGFDLREAQNGIHFTKSYFELKNKLITVR
jgi:NAD+ synthase (glutamine-hydrolysing)